jgi:hypothetical protein
MYFLLKGILTQISLAGWLGFFLKTGIVMVVFNFMMVLVFGRTAIFKELLVMAKGLAAKQR